MAADIKANRSATAGLNFGGSSLSVKSQRYDSLASLTFQPMPKPRENLIGALVMPLTLRTTPPQTNHLRHHEMGIVQSTNKLRSALRKLLGTSTSG